jgi:two-component system response regulator DesR
LVTERGAHRRTTISIATNEIAAGLSLSPATVRNHLSNAITRTGARNRVDAIRVARDAGWP